MTKRKIKDYIDRLENAGYNAIYNEGESFGRIGDVYLHDRTKEGKRQNVPYVATIGFSKGGYVFNGETFSDVGKLREAIDLYNENLPWNSENYDPVYNRQYFVRICLDDYLEMIGFEKSLWKEGKPENYWIKKDVYGNELINVFFGFSNDTEKTEGKVYMSIQEGRWLSNDFSNLDEAIAALNSTLLPKMLVAAKDFVISVGKMRKTEGKYSTLKDNKIDILALDVISENIKKDVEALLEEALEQIRNE